MEQSKLINEEQKILDSVIEKMDQELLRIKSNLNKSKLQEKKEQAKCLPDVYGDLVYEVEKYNEQIERRKDIQKAHNQLYQYHIVIHEEDSKKFDLKIGKHKYGIGDKRYIHSWSSPLCSKYVLNPELLLCEYQSSNGDIYKFHLDRSRKVDIRFDKVKDVIQRFPLQTEDGVDIIYDDFLNELTSRRSDTEFRDIIFSIQKRQGEIIGLPINQNLLVQGCAGSGKSMIMLHRLPILLNGENDIRREDIYIISPSQNYISAAENMMIELEIDDLHMGTIFDYYKYCIKKYGFNENVEYGKVLYSLFLKETEMDFVYSSKLNELIDNSYEHTYENIVKTIKEKEEIRDYLPFGFDDNDEKYLKKKLDIIIRYLIDIREDSRKKLIDNSDAVLDVWDFLHDIKNQLETQRKTDVELSSEIIGEVDSGEKFDTIIKEFKNALSDLHYILYPKNIKEYYSNVSMNSKLKEIYINLCDKVSKEKLDTDFQVIIDMLEDNEDLLDKMDLYCESVLSYESVQELNNLIETATSISQKLPNMVYKKIMKSFGIEENDKGKMYVPQDGLYIYLVCLYLYFGSPNARKEKLIAIDEVQDISIEELKLIQELNNKEAIFNLYGDENQHIESKKGINDWKELSFISSLRREDMNENYRNPIQITKYCNKEFQLKMNPISTPGGGVLTFGEEGMEELDKLLSKGMNSGKSAIIVENEEEAKVILYLFNKHKKKFNDLTEKSGKLVSGKWNIITVLQSKGLEFSTVIVFSGRMTKNMKYIASTRALDTLYIYDKKLDPLEKIIEKKVLARRLSSFKISKQTLEKIYDYTECVTVENLCKTDPEAFCLDYGLKKEELENVLSCLEVKGLPECEISRFIQNCRDVMEKYKDYIEE